MPVQLRLRQHIAVGQKTKDDPGPYGQGFNYVVDAGFKYTKDEKALRRGLNEVLKAIDHKHLSLDAPILGEPNPANITRYIFDRLKALGLPIQEIRLERGDGLTVRCTDS